MRLRTLYGALLCLVAGVSTGCGGGSGTESEVPTVVCDWSRTVPLESSDAVTAMRVVPLETRDESLLGDHLTVTPDGEGAYYIGDMTRMSFYRFDAQGRLLNRIGRRGRGPTEYLAVSQCQVVPQGCVTLYDIHRSCELVYAADGRFVERRELPGEHPVSVWREGEHRWIYRCDAPEGEDRVQCYAGDSLLCGYLSEGAPRIVIQSGWPTIAAGDGRLVVREFLRSDRLVGLDAQGAREICRFDFGPYVLSAEELASGNPYEVLMKRQTRGVMIFLHYVENARWGVAMFSRKFDGRADLVYGLCDRRTGAWSWSCYEDKGAEHPLRGGALQALTADDEVLFSVNADQLRRSGWERHPKLTNPEALAGLKEGDNPVLLYMTLKR